MKSQFFALPCAIPGIDAVAADSGRAFARHTHDQFGIGVILRGAQQSASGRGPVEAQAGDVITVNPGEVHDGSPIGEGGRAWRMLYVDPDIVWSAGLDLSEGKQAQLELTKPVAKDLRLAGDVTALFAAATGASHTEVALIVEEHLLAVLMQLGGWSSPRPVMPLDIRCALQRLDDDPSQPVSLQDLADLSGLSRFQVLRAFLKMTGLPPHAYQRQCRLHLARRLIRAKRPLAEAALEAGFADQSHMNRLFVKTYGMTPGVYAAAVR